MSRKRSREQLESTEIENGPVHESLLTPETASKRRRLQQSTDNKDTSASTADPKPTADTKKDEKSDKNLDTLSDCSESKKEEALETPQKPLCHTVVINGVPQWYSSRKLETIAYFKAKFSERWNQKQELNESEEIRTDDMTLCLKPCFIPDIHPTISHDTLKLLIEIVSNKVIPLTMKWEHLKPLCILAAFVSEPINASQVRDYLHKSHHLISKTDIETLRDSCDDFDEDTLDVLKEEVENFLESVAEFDIDDKFDVADTLMSSSNDIVNNVKKLGLPAELPNGEIEHIMVFAFENSILDVQENTWTDLKEAFLTQWKNFQKNESLWNTVTWVKLIEKIRELWSNRIVDVLWEEMLLPVSLDIIEILVSHPYGLMISRQLSHEQKRALLDVLDVVQCRTEPYGSHNSTPRRIFGLYLSHGERYHDIFGESGHDLIHGFFRDEMTWQDFTRPNSRLVLSAVMQRASNEKKFEIAKDIFVVWLGHVQSYPNGRICPEYAAIIRRVLNISIQTNRTRLSQ